jgi:hypothetical protein
MAFETGTRFKSKNSKCIDLILNSSQLELAYLAGIIDGEGSITIRRMQNGNFRPNVEVTNTDEELIIYLHKYFWQTVKKSKNSRQVPYLRVCLCGFAIDPFLAAVEPFLVAKKLQCQLVRRYIAYRKSQKWRDKPNAEMLEIIDDIKMLNTRGVEAVSNKRLIREKYATTERIDDGRKIEYRMDRFNVESNPGLHANLAGV